MLCCAAATVRASSQMWFVIYKLAKYAVFPYTWLVLLLTLLASLTQLSAARRSLRYLSFVTLAVAYLLATPFVGSLLVGSLEAQYPPFRPDTPLDPSRPRFEAIVVLAGGVRARGSLRPEDELSAASLRRTLCGVEWFHRGVAPRLFFTGGDAELFEEGPVEAVAMKRLATTVGVPDMAMTVETQSRTTYENARETRRLIGGGSVLLVTSASHIPRATALFEKQGLSATPAPCDYRVREPPGSFARLTLLDFLPDVHGLELSTTGVTEWIGLAVYRLSGKL